MNIGRRFRISPTILTELRTKGIGEPHLKTLENLPTNPTTRQGLLEALEATRHPLSKQEARIILSYSKTSLLALDKLIPNRWLREWVEALLFAFILAFAVRTYLFAPFKIPSGSMVPTIAIGDHIFATMFDYGLPLPFSTEKIFIRPVKRGDIIIFPYPKNPDLDYIKRVVALEGEVFEMRGNQVYINENPLEETYAFYEPVMTEMLKNRNETVQIGPITVPQGQVFVLGDNRFNSSDSRVWGGVPTASIRGQGRMIYWSHHPQASLFSGYQLDRVGSFLN